jgi:hypothetical protein
MSAPLFISQISRHSGVTSLTVVGHGLTAANVGNKITVVGVSDPSFNVTSTIAKVVVPDELTFNQPGLPDVHSPRSGGAIGIG